MMSSIHALQSSTTREKLLKSVQSLRPFLCESLRKSGFDPFEYFKGGDTEHDTYMQTPHYGNEKDSLQNQYFGNLGSEEHGMTAHDQAREHQMHTIYEQDVGTGGNAQYNGQHADHVNEGYNAGHIHQLYDPIGCGHNAILHDEDKGLCGYVHDEFYMDDLVSDQCTGYGHEGNRLNSSANMLELSTDVPDMLCSLEPSMCLQGMHSLTSLGFSSHADEGRFPTEEALQPTFQSHNLYLYPDLHSQQDFQHYPQCQDIINGTAASMYNMDLYTHEARCNEIAISQIPIASTPVVLSAASSEAKMTKTTCAKSASLLPSQQRKKRTKPLPDANAKRNNSFNEMDALEEDGDNCSNPNAAKASGYSSNLVCERRRRKKINEALYALRAVVPNVSKMDKASIMSDALAYAKQLRKRVDDLQNDIHNLHVGKGVDRSTSIIYEQVQEESSGSTDYPIKGMDSEKYFQSLPKHKILELGVFNMENNTYHLRICCEKGPGDLLQLTRVIEDLNFDILNSSVASVGDQSTINTVVQVDIDHGVLKPEEVKEKMLDIVSKYGLHV